MRYAARVGMVLAVVVAGIVLPGPAAQACSCAFGTPQERVGRSDAVFSGQIVDRTRTEPERHGDPWTQTNVAYTIAVDQVFKGEVYAEQTLLTGGNEAGCGLRLPASGNVLVYGTASPKESRDAAVSPVRYTTWLCSGTQMTKNVPAFVGEGEAPIGATSAYDSSLVVDYDDDPSRTPLIVGAATLLALLTAALGVLWWRRRTRSAA